MHIEARLFEFLTAFFVLSAVVYATLTAVFAHGGVEWAGVTALVMTSGLTLITGTFFRFVARRLDTRPEDYEDAEISDGAGELGFYSPHSWWPVFIALSASVTAVSGPRRIHAREQARGRPRLPTSMATASSMSSSGVPSPVTSSYCPAMARAASAPAGPSAWATPCPA